VVSVFPYAPAPVSLRINPVESLERTGDHDHTFSLYCLPQTDIPKPTLFHRTLFNSCAISSNFRRSKQATIQLPISFDPSEQSPRRPRAVPTCRPSRSYGPLILCSLFDAPLTRSKSANFTSFLFDPLIPYNASPLLRFFPPLNLSLIANKGFPTHFHSCPNPLL